MKRNLMSASQQGSRSTFLKCRAPCAAVRSLAANERSLPRGPPTAPSPALWGAPPLRSAPAQPHVFAQAKFLGHRSNRATARSHQIDCLPLVIVRKRPTLTCFHPTPPGSSRLLQVSINSEEVHLAA